MTAFDLSVILAVAPGQPDIGPSLQSIVQARAGRSIEIVVVGGDEPTVGQLPPDVVVRFRPSARDTLVPVRWGEGIVAAQAGVVACLSTEFTVTSAWLPSLLDALRTGSVGAAGAIGIASQASSTTLAMYFLRFSPFLPRAGAVAPASNIPGDGALYRRDRILEHPDLLAEGFWEIEFHQRWLAAGERLLFDPAPLVTYHAPIRLSEGMMLRYRHGVTYGSAKVLRHGNSRLRHLLAAPLLPFLLTARIGHRVIGNGGLRRGLVRALPTLLLLGGAWSLGEASGALRPSEARH